MLLFALACSVPALAQDNDGDGLANSLELLIGSNPNLADSDTDGADDWLEFYRCRNPIDSGDVGGLRCDLNFGTGAAAAEFWWCSAATSIRTRW